MQFADGLAATAEAVETHLARILGAYDPLPVVDAMGYACAGGKRLRAYLVLEGARIHGVDSTYAIWPAMAIECIHAYSLVHDDLPCMDDDDLRRGQPTVHRKWNEATAVLAGDALQTLGFELCLRPDCHPQAAVRADLALSLAQASGAQGMVLGQALDMAAEATETPLSLDQITALQAGKTGALICWSAQAGARLAQADLSPLTTYATALGLAFQIWDDVLDVEGDAATVGKAVGKDAGRGKATFVSLLGLEEAKRRAAELVHEACTALDVYGDKAESLRDCARFVISRAS